MVTTLEANISIIEIVGQMENYKNLTDSQLISLLQESDHAAYTEIYNRYFYLSYVEAYKKLRDEEQAKDVVQDIFTQFWFKREAELSGVNLAGYFYMAVRHKIFSLFAHEQVKVKYADSLKYFFDSVESVPTDHLVREKELKAHIEKSIQALPWKMRRVFELSKKENLSHTEIATMLNTNENNVSQHISGALRVLKTKLGAFLLFFL
ncbi:sigma-70 family RNA polymerase sigma factor [Mucilaginibacter sp.]|uniref:RNA polymerase sigma factor n=1 Tax=Mucilaginibacter sp. TaxID=1882438 RepID=UPI0032665D8F